MTSPFQTVSVIGLGYIGLPTAATLATRGVRVIGVDIDEKAVRQINSGKPHIVEPELDILVQAAVHSGNLTAHSKPLPADAFIIAVPTPFHPESKKPDISHVLAAASSLAPLLQPGNLVIVESTVPVGATGEVSALLARLRPDLSFPHATEGGGAEIDVAYCPERILPGHVIKELVENDRVIGGLDERSGRRAEALYRLFVEGRIERCRAPEAEFVKLAENAFRDLNIAYANELSMICEKLSLDVWEIIRLANLHPRVAILNPGPGVGGHCIAVDPWFIVDAAPSEARLTRTAREVNDAKPRFIVQKVGEAACRAADPVIACLGLSFKADIDDLRESPALRIAAELGSRFPGRVLAVEPNLGTKGLPPALEGKVRQVSLETALRQASVLVILVAHREFGELASRIPKGTAVIDAVGMLARDAAVQNAAQSEGSKEQTGKGNGCGS